MKRLLPILGIGVLLGCGGSTAPEFDTGCATSTVTLAVSAGVVPTFDWTPGCAGWDLQVTLGNSSEILWQTLTPLKNELRPPIQYEIHPAGAEDPAQQNAPPLQPGTTYRGTLYVLSNALGHRIAGQRSFTR